MAITFVASVTRGGAAGGGTTAAIDTTGASLIVISVGWNATAIVPITVTDSKSNTWSPLSFSVRTDTREQLYICLSPTVGSGHTFTVTGTAIYPAIIVTAFAGVASLQVDTGANGASSPIASGSITPAANGALILTARVSNAAATNTITPSGFTAITVAYAGGTNMGGAVGYLIQTTAAAVDATWTWTGTPTQNAVTTAVFLPVAAPAPTLVRGQRTPQVTTAAATTIAVVFGTPPTLGNAVIVAVVRAHATNNITTCADNYGNSYTLATSQGSATATRGIEIFFCPALTATGATFTVTATGTSTTRTGIAIRSQWRRRRAPARSDGDQRPDEDGRDDDRPHGGARRRRELDRRGRLLGREPRRPDGQSDAAGLDAGSGTGRGHAHVRGGYPDS